MISIIRDFFKELFTPSSSGAGRHHAAYDRGAVSVWHGVLGASVMFLAGLIGIAVPVALVVAIYALKEAVDIWNGGKFADSVEDTVSTAIGAMCAGMTALPMILLVMGVIVMIIAIARS